MDSLQNVHKPKRTLLEQLVGQLGAVPGMVAVVLGGSYASGTQNDASDLDIGLYYHEAKPFSIADIRRVAELISDQESLTVTDFYGWGPWVNGGAWIHTAQGKVDFLYRNVDQVKRTISDAQQGIVAHDYDQQPPYGFYSVTYLAETHICIPLYDPNNVIADLKRSVEIYPPKLKKRVIADSLWSAEFTIVHARGYAAQGDVYNTVGCLTRVVTNLNQVLFALNERYFIRDKQVMQTIAGFAHLPSGYVEQINRALACPGNDVSALAKSVGEIEEVWRSVVALPEVDYAPKFEV